jgi:hypothetical protein
MKERQLRKMLSFIYNIPFFGKYFKYLNAYAFRGNAKYLTQIAPLKAWKVRVYPAFRNSFVLSLLIALYVKFNDVKNFDPGQYILGAVPDLLGFAIGVFALIFVLPQSFMNHIDESKLKLSSDELPVNVAYPLLGLAISLMLCFISELFTNGSFWVNWFEAFLFVYAFEMIIDLISFISTLTRASVAVNKIKKLKVTQVPFKDRKNKFKKNNKLS